MHLELLGSVKQVKVEPYIPQTLPINMQGWNWQRLALSIGRANRALAYYDGILKTMINPTLLLSPLETREAVLSSKIEGTVTTVDEVLRYEANMKPESALKKADIQEVLNYRSAMRGSRDWLDRELPFNLNMMCAIQAALMEGVRGANKQPGCVRKEQNWIGPVGCKIEQAVYIPPEPLSLDIHLRNLVDYVNLQDEEPIIQCACYHAQFELIHPFLDGNGRTGRILIPLFLWQKGIIQAPAFYISEYLETNREVYYQRLNQISEQNDWESWVTFFLEAVAIQAGENVRKAEDVLALYQSMKERIAAISQSPKVIKILDTLFVTPIFEASSFMKLCGLTRSTTNRILIRLKEEGILMTLQEASGRTPETLAFQALMDLL
jgi:Fic family protein